jgi:hypothetical protein
MKKTVASKSRLTLAKESLKVMDVKTGVRTGLFKPWSTYPCQSAWHRCG